MNAKPFLIASLAANVLLVGGEVFLLRQIPGKPVSPPPAIGHLTNISPAAVEEVVAASPALAPAAVAGPAGTNAFDWRSVESADYHQYIANLRASGCPEKTIRDIIIADVNELFRERARSQLGSTNRFEYWKADRPMDDPFNEERVAKEQELSKQKRELLKALLGDHAPTGLDPSTTVDSSQQRREQMLDFLPADKLAPLRELTAKYGNKLMYTYKDAWQGDSSAMRMVFADRDAEMLQLLTPEQKFEYDLRMSTTAKGMRRLMGEFEPTEQQFRDMFTAQKAFDEEFGLTNMGLGPNATAEEKARRAAAEAELDARAQDILSPDGYRLYTYEPRWERDPLNPIARDYSIPKGTAFQVFDLQKAAQAEAAKVRESQALSAEQRTAALAAMRIETEKAVGQVLGPDATAAYFKRAAWIKNLAK